MLSITLLITLLITLSIAPLGGTGMVQADAPRKELRASLPVRSPIRLTASDDGPFFSLEDLRAYVPPPPKPRAWKIKPPVWKEYPQALNGIPIPPRAYPDETVRYLAGHEIRSGDRALPYVALTFDCEANPYGTSRILETLQAEGVRATFFVLGRYVYRNPEVIRQIADGGHEFGNHSFFHPQFTDITPLAATREITYTEAAIDWALGRHMPMRYIRFPYGGRNDATRLHAAALGYQSAFWDLDPRGWEPETTPEDVVAYVRKRAHPGGIMIMHCVSRNDVLALGDVIRTLRAMGLQPGTLSDVLPDEVRTVPGHPASPPPRGGG
jgi:peptidoglycan-N-acetylmuramic acid deacetylase